MLLERDKAGDRALFGHSVGNPARVGPRTERERKAGSEQSGDQHEVVQYQEGDGGQQSNPVGSDAAQRAAVKYSRDD